MNITHGPLAINMVSERIFQKVHFTDAFTAGMLAVVYGHSTVDGVEIPSVSAVTRAAGTGEADWMVIGAPQIAYSAGDNGFVLSVGIGLCRSTVSIVSRDWLVLSSTDAGYAVGEAPWSVPYDPPTGASQYAHFGYAVTGRTGAGTFTACFVMTRF